MAQHDEVSRHLAVQNSIEEIRWALRHAIYLVECYEKSQGSVADEDASKVLNEVVPPLLKHLGSSNRTIWQSSVIYFQERLADLYRQFQEDGDMTLDDLRREAESIARSTVPFLDEGHLHRVARTREQIRDEGGPLECAKAVIARSWLTEDDEKVERTDGQRPEDGIIDISARMIGNWRTKVGMDDFLPTVWDQVATSREQIGLVVELFGGDAALADEIHSVMLRRALADFREEPETVEMRKQLGARGKEGGETES